MRVRLVRKKVMPSRIVFTVDVDGKPTIAFEAKNLREAHELSSEEWLRADLCALKSDGMPICNAAARLKARIANEPERQAYYKAANVVQASEDLVLAYLVKLDGLGPGVD
jgi:hypothetical protein